MRLSQLLRSVSALLADSSRVYPLAKARPYRVSVSSRDSAAPASASLVKGVGSSTGRVTRTAWAAATGEPDPRRPRSGCHRRTAPNGSNATLAAARTASVL